MRITSYKVLGAMLALNKFTASNLSRYTGVNLATVYTVISRNKSLLDELGREETAQRGGQTKLYRIKREKIDELRAELQGLFDQVRLLPEAKDEVVTTPTIPLSLRVAEDALLRLFPRSESAKERLHLLELAELNISDGQSELEGLSTNEKTARSQSDPLRSALFRVEALKLLSEAELSLDAESGSDKALDLLSLHEKMVEAFNTLSKFDNRNAAAFGQRLINSPLMRAVVVSSLKDGSAVFEHLFPRYLLSTQTAAPSVSIDPGGLGLKTVGEQAKVRNTIAVMTVPGKNIEEEYLIYGFNEGITKNLSLARNRLIIKAMNPTSLGITPKANLPEEARSIGHQLNVDTVLMNTLDRVGKNMRCRSTLFDVVNDSPIWSHTYASNESELFDVQEDISKAVSENLHIRLTEPERQLLARRSTDDTEAYQLYLKGRYYWSLWTLDGVKKSIECFNKALDKDPCYALAHAGLADGYNMLVYSGESTPRECFTKAKAEAVEALEIDDSLAEAYTSLAYSRARYYWKWKEAEKGYRAAIGLNPNYPIARLWYSEYLAAFERFDEAILEIDLAYELEPFSPIVNVTRGSIHYLTRQYDQAVEQFQRTLKLDPTYVRAHSRLGGVYVQQGLYPKAIHHLRKCLQLSGKHPRELAMLGYAFAASGNSAEAGRILNEIKGLSEQRYISQYDMSLVFVGLGDSEQALERLRKAHDDRDPWIVFLNVDPRLDSLRKLPEFREIVKRVGLVSKQKMSEVVSDAHTPSAGNPPLIGVSREWEFTKDTGEARAGEVIGSRAPRQGANGETIPSENEPISLEAIKISLSVMRVVVEPKTRADQDKLGVALGRLAQEDPYFSVSTDHETGHTIIAGMGELHLEIIVDRMKREFGVEASVGKPQVAYRETITQPAPGKGIFKKQTGGRGQYAHVELAIEPAPGEGFVFDNEIKGGAIPREFIKPTEQGIHDAMERGYLAGYDMVDIRVRLIGGGFHEVDSDERAFTIAGSLAFQDALRKAKPVLLEPIMRVEVVTPNEYMGAVNGDLRQRRGQIEKMEPRPGGMQVITSFVPLSDMFGYTTDLHSATHGRAISTMHFERYEQVPKNIADVVTLKEEEIAEFIDY